MIDQKNNFLEKNNSLWLFIS